MAKKGKQKAICIDFDGVIHSYTSGFTGLDYIKDPPVSGALEMLEVYLQHFTVYIFSTRCESERGINGMKKWFERHGFDHTRLHFAKNKPKAGLYIDDRGYEFHGYFPTVEFIKDFKPWTKRNEEDTA